MRRMFGLSLKSKEADKLIPLFGGFCFFLSAVEVMIPKPLPFFRIGLANLPILIGAEIFSFPAFLMLLIVKIAGQALISGTLFSYVILFSFLSTCFSGLLMYAMKYVPKRWISFIGISIAGALVSNSIQLLLAVFIIFGRSAVYIIPPMFIAGMLTSVFLGAFANEFTAYSTWYENVKNGTFRFSLKEQALPSDPKPAEKYLRVGSGALLMLLLLFVDFLPMQAVILGTALILCVVDRQPIHFINIILLFITIVFFNLFPPSGKVVFSVMGLDVTVEALLRGIKKAVIFEGMIYISKWILKAKINLRGKIGGPVSASFRIFYKLLSVKHEVKRKNIIASIDSILLSIDKL